MVDFYYAIQGTEKSLDVNLLFANIRRGFVTSKHNFNNHLLKSIYLPHLKIKYDVHLKKKKKLGSWFVAKNLG